MGVKFIWWSYAKRMIAAYPARKAWYESALQQYPAPHLDDAPGAHQPRADPIGDYLARLEKSAFYQEYRAVHSALQVCSVRNPYLLDFVKLYYWRRPSLSLEQVADKLNYSPETVRKWNKKLIYAVATCRGLLDESPEGQKG